VRAAAARAVAQLPRDRHAWAVLVTVAAHTNREGIADPGPSQRSLAALTGRSTRTVRDALARLTAAGLVTYGRGTSQHTPSRYALVWMQPAAVGTVHRCSRVRTHRTAVHRERGVSARGHGTVSAQGPLSTPKGVEARAVRLALDGSEHHRLCDCRECGTTRKHGHVGQACGALLTIQPKGFGQPT
jgi:hypothetical protein